MHAESIMRKFRILTFILPALALASCTTGDGPESIANTPATPLPNLPPGFCDAINFELLCELPPITNFASGFTDVIDNPDMSGINTSDRVARMQKFFNPVELFGGSRLDLASPALLDKPVSELSVGQQQRVAAARALIGSPDIILADEPTSALDAANRENFIELLFQECADTNATLIFVSHDASLGPMFDRAVQLEGGAAC